MKAGFGVDADPKEAAGAWGEVVDSFVAAGDGKFIFEGDRVEASVGDTKSPDEVVDVGDLFLVWFRCEDDHGEPAAEAGVKADPIGFLEGVKLVRHDFGFVDAVAWLAAGNGCSGTGVNAEFVVEDWSRDAAGDEGVPIALDDVGEASGEGRVEVGGG